MLSTKQETGRQGLRGKVRFGQVKGKLLACHCQGDGLRCGVE